MLWCWMDMQLDEVRELGELWKYESYRPNTALPPSLDSRSDLLQEDLGGSPVGSARGIAPPLRGVILIVIVYVGEDGTSLFEETIYDTRLPQ
jgi:hypothetical protein